MRGLTLITGCASLVIAACREQPVCSVDGEEAQATGSSLLAFDAGWRQKKHREPQHAPIGVPSARKLKTHRTQTVALNGGQREEKRQHPWVAGSPDPERGPIGISEARGRFREHAPTPEPSVYLDKLTARTPPAAEKEDKKEKPYGEGGADPFLDPDAEETTTTVMPTLKPLKELSDAEAKKLNETRQKALEDCLLSEWLDWSDCSARTDGTRQAMSTRTRVIVNPPKECDKESEKPEDVKDVENGEECKDGKPCGETVEVQSCRPENTGEEDDTPSLPVDD